MCFSYREILQCNIDFDKEICARIGILDTRGIKAEHKKHKNLVPFVLRLVPLVFLPPQSLDNFRPTIRKECILDFIDDENLLVLQV